MHPEIISIISIKDHAREQKMNGDYVGLLYTLDTLMREIKTEEQDKELGKLIKKEIRVLENIPYATKKNRRIFNMKWKYADWYEKIIQLLWIHKYLENEKYQPFKLEEDKLDFG